MALLQSQSLPGIGCCSSSIVLARARVQQCLAAASHSQAPLLQANGGRAGLPSSSSILKAGNAISFSRRRRRDLRVVAEAATAGTAKVTPASSGGVSLSDVLWPSAGAFLAMAVLGKMDQMVAFKGVSLTIAPLGAVCCVLFSAPDSPAAKKYNMFVAQIACAAFGVLALSLFGPGWLARGAALSACIAFMTITGTSHPPGKTPKTNVSSGCVALAVLHIISSLLNSCFVHCL
uniref:HPP transmembrane region domain-containing protein n=1 Tax=Zea mays TaxID=4577 RepID=A0A804M222_MAIZE